MIKFPPKKILVAYDLSDVSRTAWRHAAALAENCGAELDVVYVEPWQAGVDLLPPPALTPAVLRPLRARIRKEVGEGPRIAILQGDAAQSILSMAGRTRPDMIVVGTHGRKGFRRLLLGSTAEAVIRGARVPVLVARGPVREIRSILAPVNFTSYSDYGFSYAAGAGAVLSARVTALHVTGDPIWDGNPRYRLAGLIRRLPPQVLERGRPALAESVGDTVPQILKATRGHDWLVLVAHGKSIIKDAFLGTTIEQVLRRSSIPVLSVPVPSRAHFAVKATAAQDRAATKLTKS